MEANDSDLIRKFIFGFLLVGNQEFIEGKGSGDSGVVWVVRAHGVRLIDYNSNFAVAAVSLSCLLSERGGDEECERCPGEDKFDPIIFVTMISNSGIECLHFKRMQCSK